MENKEIDDDNKKKYSQKLKENIRDNTTPSMGSLDWNSTIQKKGNQSLIESDA